MSGPGRRITGAALVILPWVSCAPKQLSGSISGRELARQYIVPGATQSDEVSAMGDLVQLVLDLRKDMKHLTDKVNGRGFTPRADKPDTRRAGARFAAGPVSSNQRLTCKCRNEGIIIL